MENVLYFQYSCLGFLLGCIVTILSILAFDGRYNAKQDSLLVTLVVTLGKGLAWLLFGFLLATVLINI
jgi:hypothetical protein